MKYDLRIKVQTYADLTSWKMGGEILSPLFREGRLAPERVSSFSEVTASHGFDVRSIQDCSSHWAPKGVMRIDDAPREFSADFHWKRRKVVKSQGYVFFAPVRRDGKKIPSCVSVNSVFRKEIDWAKLFMDWCVTTTPHTAILHPLVTQDGPKKLNKDLRDYSHEENVSWQAWSRFLGGGLYCEFRAGELNSLVSGLSNLGWASYLGGEYASEVDVAAISAAGFPVQKVGDGYLLQLTEDINNVIDDFTSFSRQRAKLKSLFRGDLFLIKDEPVIY